MNGPTYDQLLAVFEAAKSNGQGSAHLGPDGLIIVDWCEERDVAAELVEGFAMAGRWTAIAAAAKAGKSSLLVSMSVEVSEGRHPFDGTPIEPVRVLYVDAEMGRVDLEERLIECGYVPVDLKNWSACDIPPRLDTVAGAALVLDYVRANEVQMVVIDGINGTVSGAEKDDTPWRLLFEHTIAPLKALAVAVVTADNLGKDATLGPRGSSVKLDKADAVLNLTRTATGVHLHTSHRRTAAYPLDQYLDAIGIEGDADVRYRRTVGQTYPDGTKEVADLLDELGVDPEMSRRATRALLRSMADEADDPTRFRVRDVTLGAALRWRKEARMRLGTTRNRGFGNQEREPETHMPSDQGEPLSGTTGTRGVGYVGTTRGVVDTLVPNPAVDPNNELF